MDICSPRAQCTSANPSSSIEAHPPSSAIRENGPNRLSKLSRRPGRRIHAPQRWLVILHGAFGAGRNWGTIARRLAQVRPEWGVVLADLRMHGASQGFPPPHTLEAAAADVDVLGRSLRVPFDAALGHSLGGKIALLYAARHAVALQQVWLVESTPAAGPPAGRGWQMLRALRALPPQFPSRQEAAEGLAQFGFAPDVARWMTTNLESSDGRFRWRLDFDALEDLLRDFFQTDLWSVVLDPPAGVALHVITASESAG